MIVRNPFALALLAIAGAVSIPAWTFGVAVAAPLSGPPVHSVGVVVALLFQLLLLQLPWVLLVAAALQGTMSGGRSAMARPVPALPVGLRTRLVAETLLAVVFVAVARVAFLLAAGPSFGTQMFLGFQWSGYTYQGALAVSTLLGTLFAFPLVLGWTAIARFDARGVVRLLLVAILLVAASDFGLMAHAWTALLICVAVSALVLARPDDGSRPPDRAGRAAAASLRRRSPGAEAQFRRDAGLGPVRSLWLFGLLVLVFPLGIELSMVAGLPRPPMVGALPFFQLLALAALPFFPLGLRLVPPSGNQPFSGYFLRAWSVLPVRPERVARAVYVHALGSAAVVWLVLWAQFALHGVQGLRLQVFEIPVVVLAGAIVLCEAVGDRTRGLLAVACLVGTHAVPTAHLIVGSMLPSVAMPAEPWDLKSYTLLAYGFGLLGGLPPLVHLRRRAPSTAAMAV